MRPVKAAKRTTTRGSGPGVIARLVSRLRGNAPGKSGRARANPLPRKAIGAERARWRSVWTSGRGVRGAGVLAVIGLFAATGLYGAVAGGHVPSVGQAWRLGFSAVTRHAGFGLAEVTITGAQRMTPAEVIEQMGLTGTTSLLAFDANEARERLLEAPWIRSATVRVYLPGRVAVTVTEREPFAIWQRQGQVSLIDRAGRVIGPYDDARFSHLPLVVGEGAERRVGEVGALLDPHPAVRSRVRAAVLVAERRWTLKLADGVDVMLPEADPAGAMTLLARLDRDTGLLNRDVAAIDMRLADRVVVRLTDRAAGMRNDQLRQRTRMPQRAERQIILATRRDT